MMGKPGRPDPTPIGTSAATGDDSGWSPSLGLLAIAVGLVAGGLAWWWQSPPSAPSAPATAQAVSSPPQPAITPPIATAASGASTARPVPGASPGTGAAPVQALRIPRLRDPNGDLSPDLADYVNEGERPTMAEVISRLHQAGVYTGLGAFSPPGTRPPLLGLAVPEDFPLPAGYVRHYQATDDGQRIEPILMFAPDFQLLDAARQPVALPADRVVPPELAPPGLPIRRIVVPAPVDRPGS